MEEIEGMDEDTGMNEDEDMDDCSSSDEPLLLLGAPTASDPAVTPQGSVSLQEHQQVPELRLPHQSDHEHGSATSIRRSRLAIPQVTASYRIPAVGQPISRFQTHTLSRLEVENAFLQNQNDSLNRDIQHCRQTVHALKRILAQKEDVIQRMQEEYRQAYMKTKFMESVLAEHHNISFSGSGKLQQASIKDSGSATVFKVQDEQRLGALLKEAAYKDMDDRNRSLGNSQYGMLGHSYDPDEDEEDEEDEEDDFSSNYSDNSEEEDSEADETEEVEEVKENEGDEDSEGYAPAPHHRFRDLAYDRLSYDAHTLTVASEVVAPAVYTGEQYTSSFDSSTAGPTSAPVGPRQTLRRRPRLQLNLDVQNLVSPHLSSIHSPQDGSPAMPFSESEHCSGSLRSTAVGEMDSVFHDDDHYDNNQELATGKRDRIVLRDSGHFPTEFSPLDNHDDPYDDKLALRVDATTILTSEAGSEAQFPSVTAKDSRHNSAPHSNSHTFVEAGPLSNALLVTRCIQTQTSASFSDTTASETQTDNSHEDAQGSYGDTNPFGRRSNDSSTTVPAAGGDNADDAGDGDEGRSEFSVSTMISPMTEAQDLAETVSTSTAFTDVVQPYVGVSSAEGESRKTLKGHISEPLKLNEKEVPSSSLSFRFPSGMKHKVLLGRSRSKTMSNAMRESCHGRAEKKADAAAVSPTALLMTESTEETEFMSSPFSLTATGSLILLDSVRFGTCVSDQTQINYSDPIADMEWTWQTDSGIVWHQPLRKSIKRSETSCRNGRWRQHLRDGRLWRCGQSSGSGSSDGGASARQYFVAEERRTYDGEGHWGPSAGLTVAITVFGDQRG
ncbi:hypothetical protein BGZ54_010071 [Gamsiella multidivaricata]|nr:hypothetical protein BGZ54_010071 [Gamsiella multidivaricata]